MAKTSKPEEDALPNFITPGTNWNLIPAHMRQAVIEYITVGRVDTDDFLYHVVTNNLRRSVETADHVNLDFLKGYVTFFFNYCPSGSWGSEEKVRDWCSKGGLNGRVG